MTSIEHESEDVLSLTMQSRDGQPLSAALPGQYVVVRLHPTAGGPALFRSYSLSGAQSTEHYRVSVKLEPNGAAGTYIREHVHVGDALDVSAPRGSFILQSDERPVVLVSAGIGATPVLSMLYALSEARSTRQVFWLHGTRDRQHHPFVAEVRRLMLALPNGHSFVCYSRPGAHDTAEDFNATGHLSRAVFEEVGVSRDADVYVCGPGRFMAEMKEALVAVGVAPERIHVELFNGSESMAPGVVAAETRAPHLPADDADTVRSCRSRAAASPHTGRRRLTRAFWSWQRRATSRFGGRAGPVCVTAARAVSSRGRSPTDRSHSTSLPTAISSSAAHSRFATSSSTCNLRPDMEDQGAADQAEANARRDERHEHGSREDRQNRK